MCSHANDKHFLYVSEFGENALFFFIKTAFLYFLFAEVSL